MKKAIRPEDPVIIYLISLALCQLAALALAKIFPDGGDGFVFASYAAPQVFYIGVTAAYMGIGRVRFSLLPAREGVRGAHYAVAAAMGIGLFFFALLPNFGLQKLFAMMDKAPTVTVPDLSSAGGCIAALFCMCLLPSVGEELLFRKAFCDGFASYGEVTAILLSGFLFGISHLNLAQTLHQVFLGCVLAYLYLKTGNVTLTALIHFINNALALFLTRITGEGMWNNIVILAVSTAAGLVVLSLCAWYLMKRTPRLSIKKETKPSFFVIAFVVLLTLLWLVAAIL